MATLIADIDFESGTLASIFPGGASSSVSLTTTQAKFGVQSMQCSSGYQQHKFGAASVWVGRFYVYFVGLPASLEFFNIYPNVGGAMRCGIDNTTKKMGWN